MGAMRTYLLGIALCAALSATASAQQLGTGSPLRLKLGVLQPRGDARDVMGSQHLGGMADITMARSPDGSTLSVGYFGAQRNGQKMRTVPVLLTKSSEGVSPIPGLAGFYTGSGFGAYFIDAAGSGFKTRWGGYISAGIRLAGDLFAEAQYHYVSSGVNGFSPSGVALLVGRKL